MEVALKYGQTKRLLAIPERAGVSILSPSALPVVENLNTAFEEAMDCPVNSPPLEAMAEPRDVAIAIPDETRPAPVKSLLPLLLERLYNAFPSLTPNRVTIVIATGLHPPLDNEGIRRVVPESVAPGCMVISHDAVYSQMVDFGTTGMGTPVRINKAFARAELKLVIGNIDPHQFVGFTGGAKGGVIGCGSKNTIEANHSLMFHEHARVATIEGNPVRADIDEAGAMVHIPMVINVVLDATNRVVRLLAGEPIAVYREGAETCAALYGVAIKERFDIVVASCGGYPKDINLYQAQKGLAQAAQAAKPGGKILLAAACPQGVGDEVYFEYVSRFPDPESVLEDFTAMGFKMGAHKAFLFARTLVAFDVTVASDIRQEILSQCHIKSGDPQASIEGWIDGFPGRPTVALIPNANTSYFYIK